jgi:hypothetical protein
MAATSQYGRKIMKTQRTVNDTVIGRPIPVTVDLKVSPLTYSAFDKEGNFIKNRPVINGHGRQIMNDEWIYVTMPNYGPMSINVNRANYCQKVYLMNTKITDTINKKASRRLQKFIDTVADTLVFEKNGVSYRIYLNEGRKEMELASVKPYWATVGTGGIMPSWDSVIKKYGAHPGWDYVPGTDCKVHKLDIDLKAKFGFSYEN